MAKTYGVGYPERELMKVLSDLLGIEHFTTARGGTVRSDFLHAVATRLGIEDPQGFAKDPLILEIASAAYHGKPPDFPWLSPGGTVKNETLAMWIDGIVLNHKLGPADKPGPTPIQPGGPPNPNLPTGEKALELPLKVLEDMLDPDHGLDPEDRRLLAVAYREGQDHFRIAVLEAYRQGGAEACCVTGHGPVQALEAAHIVPHGAGGVMTVDNGLCLRVDVHRLFDRRLMAVHETSLEVLAHPVLMVVPEYADVVGKKIHTPAAATDKPAPAASRRCLRAAGL
jgi:hypothetical protein